MPDVTFAVTEPLASPQLAFVGVSVIVGSGESFTVAVVVAVQLLASVTVTVYVLDTTLLKSYVVAPLLQLML